MNIESPIKPPAAEAVAERALLGALLRARAGVSETAIAEALAAQADGSGRLGERIAAMGAASEGAVAAAMAEQYGLGVVDLDLQPPEPGLTIAADAPAYLAEGVIPWRRTGQVTAYAVTDPEKAGAGLARLSQRSAEACLFVTTRTGLERAVARAFAPQLAARAARRTPPGLSVRGITALRRRALLVLLALAAAMALGGPVALGAGLMALFAINAATTGLRLAALFAGGARGTPHGAPRPPRRAALPMISLLVPLYREANMIEALVAALSRLDYPRDRVEVRLLLEEGDRETREAVEAAALPRWIRPLVVPEGRPRTKPRALNHALDFCRGDIVGILDAEDRPDPDQLRAVVHALETAGPRTACVQCQLSYYNARQNWISRCFQMEYAIWFEVLLPGFRALGLPIPLGGTSVYFRREVVAALGGWDAHNVTEDADLGMRLARAGYEVAVLRSVTEEEATCRLTRWVRQRSRWLKGYILTWLSHMRSPRRLWRELGARGFVGLNLLFVGAATAYLAMPLFWAAVILWAVEGAPAWRVWLPDWVVLPALLSMAVGQAVMLACATLAMMRRGAPGLLFWVPTLPLYWTLGAIAAWKAVIELFAAPFYWDKTPHGQQPWRRRRRAAPPRRAEPVPPAMPPACPAPGAGRAPAAAGARGADPVR